MTEGRMLEVGVIKFCRGHWDALRDATKEQGLGDYIAPNGEEANRRLQAAMDDDAGVSLDSFEPLIGAVFAILSNLSNTIENIYLVHGCPLCAANRAHAEGCRDPECKAKDEPDKAFDWMPARAAREQKEILDELLARDAS